MRRRRVSEQQEEETGVAGGPRASGMLATSSSIEEGQSGARGHAGPDSEISESEEEDELVVLREDSEELEEERLLKMSKMMRFENKFEKSCICHWSSSLS